MDTQRVIYVDIETDNLLFDVTKIHCISTKRRGTTHYWHNGPPLLVHDVSYFGTIEECVRWLTYMSTKGWYIVMHNGDGYDLPVIRKLMPTTPLFPIVDTLAMSRVLYPERASHSLDSWGQELGELKVVHEDWSTLTADMILRCNGDVSLTEKLFKYLLKHPDLADVKDISKEPWLRLEQETMRIHSKQTEYGVRFNVEAAARLYHNLSFKRDSLAKKIAGEAPWTCSIPSVAKMRQESWKKDQMRIVSESQGVTSLLMGSPAFKMNGDYNVATKKYFGDDYLTVTGAYTKVSFDPMNLNSSAEVKEFLLTLGWKPTEWNYSFADGRKHKTSPKLTEESYASLPDGLGQDIATYNVLKHRCNFLFNPDDKGRKEYHKGALATVANKRGDGRVSADAVTCGTPTARYRHQGVVCNIPRPGTPYGSDIRALFCVPKGRAMLGIDLAGIEARMLAHFILPFPGGPELAEIITDGDFHQHNADLWGVDRNSHAKGGLYALMYGCFPPKLAETLGKPASMGQELYDNFWIVNAPIKLLVESLEDEYDRNGGKIRGLDGRWLHVREKRKLLNTLLQNAAAIVFKHWMVLCDEYLCSNPTSKVYQTIAYHDELQFESHYDEVTTKSIGSKICDLALESGVHFKIRVPTPADMKLGVSWKDTH